MTLAPHPSGFKTKYGMLADRLLAVAAPEPRTVPTATGVWGALDAPLVAVIVEQLLFIPDQERCGVALSLARRRTVRDVTALMQTCRAIYEAIITEGAELRREVACRMAVGATPRAWNTNTPFLIHYRLEKHSVNMLAFLKVLCKGLALHCASTHCQLTRRCINSIRGQTGRVRVALDACSKLTASDSRGFVYDRTRAPGRGSEPVRRLTCLQATGGAWSAHSELLIHRRTTVGADVKRLAASPCGRFLLVLLTSTTRSEENEFSDYYQQRVLQLWDVEANELRTIDPMPVNFHFLAFWFHGAGQAAWFSVLQTYEPVPDNFHPDIADEGIADGLWSCVLTFNRNLEPCKFSLDGPLRITPSPSASGNHVLALGANYRATVWSVVVMDIVDDSEISLTDNAKRGVCALSLAPAADRAVILSDYGQKLVIYERLSKYTWTIAHAVSLMTSSDTLVSWNRCLECRMAHSPCGSAVVVITRGVGMRYVRFTESGYVVIDPIDQTHTIAGALPTDLVWSGAGLWVATHRGALFVDQNRNQD